MIHNKTTNYDIVLLILNQTYLLWKISFAIWILESVTKKKIHNMENSKHPTSISVKVYPETCSTGKTSTSQMHQLEVGLKLHFIATLYIERNCQDKQSTIYTKHKRRSQADWMSDESTLTAAKKSLLE